MATFVASALVLGAGTIIPFATSDNVAQAESNCEEIYYVNSNQISMTKAQYDLLNTIGFEDSEIDSITEEKFIKLTSMDVLKTQCVTSRINDGDAIENTEADDNLYDLLENTQQSIALTMASGKNYQASDGTKVMNTYVSFVKVTSGYKIYVKQNVRWSSAPKERYTDILSIRYTNNVRVAEYNGYPDVEMHLRYTRHVYSKNGWKYKNPKYTVTENDYYEENDYTGQSTSAYEHKIGDYFAFQFALPEDKVVDGSSQRYYMYSKTTYKDFYVTMESTFDTNFSTLTGTEMQAYYVHQNDSGHIDWGNLTFTTSAPYISYSTSFWVNDPGFETALFSSMSIQFDDVLLSRC